MEATVPTFKPATITTSPHAFTVRISLPLELSPRGRLAALGYIGRIYAPFLRYYRFEGLATLYLETHPNPDALQVMRNYADRVTTRINSGA